MEGESLGGNERGEYEDLGVWVRKRGAEEDNKGDCGDPLPAFAPLWEQLGFLDFEVAVLIEALTFPGVSAGGRAGKVTGKKKKKKDISFF